MQDYADNDALALDPPGSERVYRTFACA